MNLNEALLKEHSRNNAIAIAAWIGSDADKFAQLMDLFFEEKGKISQRAAWVVQFCAENDLNLIKPYISKLWENLEKNNIHDATKRITLRTFQYIPIETELQGIATNICFNYLQSNTEPVAIKCFAMQVLANICEEEPDLIPELKLLIDAQYNYATGAFKAKAKSVFKQLKIA